ncbi:MAG: hypothetical protein PWQ96_2225 [Clostridia bacterium]|nr:hypothetical protein [Clostridia bacterium]
MKRKLIGLLIVALLVVMAVPVFAADNTTQNEELKALYKQMYELQKQIAEKRGLEYDEDFFRQMYDYCNGMMGGYGMMGYGMMGW